MPLILKDPLPWEPIQSMDDYLMELDAEGRARNYRRMVKVGLSYFSQYLRKEGVLAPDEIDRTHIVRFQSHLAELRKDDGEPYAQSYRSKIMDYVKGWCSWMEATGVVESSPWVRIRVPKVTKKPKPLEPDELIALFETHKRDAFQMAPFDYHQREVILTLLYSWGLRVHELCSVNVAHVDMRLDSVIVRNKGGGKKVMPYGEVEKTVVSRWLRHRAGMANIDEDALLVSRSGVRITSQRVWEVVSNLGKKAGVDVNPHRFRDTLGTTMLDNDVPVEVVMKLLGHSNRAQTLAYARLNDPVVARAHKNVMQGNLTALLRFNNKDA